MPFLNSIFPPSAEIFTIPLAAFSITVVLLSNVTFPPFEVIFNSAPTAFEIAVKLLLKLTFPFSAVMFVIAFSLFIIAVSVEFLIVISFEIAERFSSLAFSIATVLSVNSIAALFATKLTTAPVEFWIAVVF